MSVSLRRSLFGIHDFVKLKRNHLHLRQSLVEFRIAAFGLDSEAQYFQFHTVNRGGTLQVECYER